MNIQIPREEIAEFCRRNHIQKLSLFGSVLRGDFGESSDVDVLVEFEAGAKHSLFDLVHMQRELREILGREVDLVDRRDVERSENYIRRKHILNSLETVYVA
jgi:hypothetical protein